MESIFLLGLFTLLSTNCSLKMFTTAGEAFEIAELYEKIVLLLLFIPFSVGNTSKIFKKTMPNIKPINKEIINL